MIRPPRHYGYVRASTLTQELSPEAQRDAISKHARLEGITIDTWVEDPATSAKIRFDKRDGGGEFNRIAKAGDTIWLGKLDRAFRSLADCALMLDMWERKTIQIRICDIGGQFDISTPQGKAFVQMLAIFAELERKMNSVRTREALAVLKRDNKANGKYAGYGFKWRRVWDNAKNAGQGGWTKHKISNPDERAVMAEIAKWRIDGYDYDSIYHHLRKSKIKTTDGKEWSRDRVKRAYQAELRLQQIESGPPKTQRENA
jgi:DNA invertase Pin-like site-specific DNA recombinase